MEDKVQKTLKILDKIDFLIFPISYALLVVCVSIYAPKLGYKLIVEEYLSTWYLELNNSLGGYVITFFWAFLDALVVLTLFLAIKSAIQSFLPKDNSRNTVNSGEKSLFPKSRGK